MSIMYLIMYNMDENRTCKANQSIGCAIQFYLYEGKGANYNKELVLGALWLFHKFLNCL